MSREPESPNQATESLEDDVKRITDDFDDAVNSLNDRIIADTVGDSICSSQELDLALTALLGPFGCLALALSKLFRRFYDFAVESFKQRSLASKKKTAPYNDVFDPLTLDFDGGTRFKCNCFTDSSDPRWQKFWKELFADIKSYRSAITRMTEIARELKLDSLVAAEASVNACTKAFNMNLRRIKLLVEKGDYNSSKEILALATKIATENKVYLERVVKFKSTIVQIRNQYLAEQQREKFDNLKAEDDKLKDEIDLSAGSDLELFSEAISEAFSSGISTRKPSATQSTPASTPEPAVMTSKKG